MKPLLLLFTAAGLLLGQPAGPARRQPAEPPPLDYRNLKYGPLGQVKIPEIPVHTLPNGMKVYLLENHELPLVSGFALVRTGNLFDPPDKVGLATMTGMVMRTGGTKSRTGEQLDLELENIAASVESSIGESSGRVGFSCLKENLDQVLAIFKEVLTAPEFRQDKVELARTQLRGGIARRNDEAEDILSREFASTIYGRDNPYGWDMNYEHIDRIQRDDLTGFYERFFFPANIMLAVQGDFPAAEMRSKLEALFAGWQVKREPVPAFPPVTAKPAPGIYLATKNDVTQTFFRMGHLGGVLKDPDYPALAVMSDILGGGFSSRLFINVRTKLGYVYSIGGGWGADFDHPGIFYIDGSTQSARTVDAIKAAQAEIDRIRTAEVTDRELESSKQTVLNGFVFNFDHPSKTLSRVVTYDYYGYPRDFIFQYQKAVAATTKADILRVAKTNIDPQRIATVAVGKPSEFGTPLTALGAVKDIDLTIPEPKRAEAPKAGGPESAAKAKALLQRAQEAMGGAAKIAGVRDMTVSATMRFSSPQGELEGKQQMRWIAPAEMRIDQEFAFGDVRIYYDGKGGGWLVSPQGEMPLPPQLVQQFEGSALRVMPLSLLSDRNPERTVTLVAENTVEIADKKGNSTRIEFGADGLPVRQTYRTFNGFTGQQVTQTEVFSDWKDSPAGKIAGTIQIEQDGTKVGGVNVSEVRVNTGLTSADLSRK